MMQNQGLLNPTTQDFPRLGRSQCGTRVLAASVSAPEVQLNSRNRQYLAGCPAWVFAVRQAVVSNASGSSLSELVEV